MFNRIVICLFCAALMFAFAAPASAAARLDDDSITECRKADNSACRASCRPSCESVCGPRTASGESGCEDKCLRAFRDALASGDSGDKNRENKKVDDRSGNS